VEATPPGVDR